MGALDSKTIETSYYIGETTIRTTTNHTTADSLGIVSIGLLFQVLAQVYEASEQSGAPRTRTAGAMHGTTTGSCWLENLVFGVGLGAVVLVVFVKLVLLSLLRGGQQCQWRQQRRNGGSRIITTVAYFGVLVVGVVLGGVVNAFKFESSCFYCCC